MHLWGDPNFDWEGLYSAEAYIVRYVWLRSRYWLVTKEKYGTIRYEMLYPKRNTWLGRLQFRWAVWLANRAISKACKRWPHLTEAIREEWDFIWDGN